MAELTNQIQAFSLTLVLGIITGVIFHYYQLFIRQARVGRYSLYLMDLLLWLLIITLVFGAMIWINQGEVRFYILIALLIGILIYFHNLSGRLNAYLTSLAAQNIRVLAYIARWFRKGWGWIKVAFSRIILRRKNPPPNPG